MWEYIVGGSLVFGVIVIIGAWINGRITGREISRLRAEEHKATRELIARIDDRTARWMINLLGWINDLLRQMNASRTCSKG